MDDIRTINLCGKKYEIKKSTMLKIPYIADMIQACGDQQTIFIERLPHVFDHVLAFIIDDLYPYPYEYAYELDFYNIQYDKTKLYNPQDQMKKHIDHCQKEIKIQLNLFEKQTKDKLDILESITLSDYHAYYRDYGCRKCDKRIRWNVNKLLCNNCQEKTNCCFDDQCKNQIHMFGNTKSNYCKEHLANTIYCCNRGCGNVKIKEKLFCFKCLR
jgi:hypothetical protein